MPAHQSSDLGSALVELVQALAELAAEEGA